jgi:cation:H+ antiporter
MIWIWVLLLIISFAMLYYGAELSLESSEVIGKKLGLSPLLVGMLLIGFGTSLPEGFVGHIAAFDGRGSIALGSLVGSNIANMLLILGVSSLFTQLLILEKGLKQQLVIHFFLGIALWFVLQAKSLTLLTATPLLVIIAIYMYFVYREVKHNPYVEEKLESEEPENKEEKKKKNTGVIFIKMLFGFGLLFIGGELLVDNAIKVCNFIGIEEYVISAILVAFGTSFPELVTSLLAALKGKDSNLIIGNIVGSNVFNCALILGSLGIYEFEITQNLQVEVIILLIGSGYLLFLNLFKINFNLFSGIIFLAGYSAAIIHWLKVF